MFAQLPESIQQQLKEYLERNNFRDAKRLYDDAVRLYAGHLQNNSLHDNEAHC